MAAETVEGSNETFFERKWCSAKGSANMSGEGVGTVIRLTKHFDVLRRVLD